MSVLMIAPTGSDLPNVAIEAAAVVNALGGTLVQGPVTERDVRDAASAGGFEGIWFATHAGIVDGITRVLLSEESLSEESVVAYVAASGASWCFLNTCASNVLGLRILDETLADVLCTVSALPDPNAMRTGVLFARQLALLKDPWTAYQRSKPGGNRQYNFLVNYRQREMVVAGTAGSPAQSQQQERLQITMDEMRRDVGTIASDVAVLKTQMRQVETKQDRADDRLSRIEDQLRPAPVWQTWAMLIIGLIMCVAVVALLLRLNG
jgi:hypothetical protein